MKNAITLWILVLTIVGQSFGQVNPCNVPMATRDFTQSFGEIATMYYGKDQAIRDLTLNNCMTSNQIRQIATLYSTDDDRLNYAYYAYGYAFDPNNYSVVANTMSSPQYRQALLDFINDNPLDVAEPMPMIPQPQPVPNPYPQPAPVPQPVPVPVPAPPVYVPGYTGRIGCSLPMSDIEFNQSTALIANQSFENTRLQVAKQVVSTKCVTANQALQIANMFDFESKKLDFAKFAFLYTYDIDNYYLVANSFDFESNVRNLMDYINVNMPVNAPYAGQPDPYFQGGPVSPVPQPQPEPYYPPQPDPYYQPAPVPAPAPAPPVFVPGYTGRIGCEFPMDESEFAQARISIANQTFENTKLTVAKQIANSRCMTAAQVLDLMNQFDFENTKLDFAKYAYQSTYDIDNYYLVANSFDFENSTRELMEFISGR